MRNLHFYERTQSRKNNKEREQRHKQHQKKKTETVKKKQLGFVNYPTKTLISDNIFFKSFTKLPENTWLHKKVHKV